MLNQQIDEIVMEGGKVGGVKSGDLIAKCSMVLCDPSYAMDKVKSIGKVIRSICLLEHTVPNTMDADSAQIIIPQKQLNRMNDIYISIINSKHRVCASPYYIAICSTAVETSTPE